MQCMVKSTYFILNNHQQLKTLNTNSYVNINYISAIYKMEKRSITKRNGEKKTSKINLYLRKSEQGIFVGKMDRRIEELTDGQDECNIDGVLLFLESPTEYNMFYLGMYVFD